MTIKEKQEEIIEEFKEFDDWMDRYQLLIDKGQELEAFDESYRTDTYLIEGCQSKVWLYATYQEGRVHYFADSNTVIVKGIAALLVSVLSNQTPQEILDADLFFIKEIGLQENLSPTRSNGLVSMVKQIRSYALAFKLKEE